MQNYTDYLMIISAPESIIKEIDRYKRASINLIGHFEGMHSAAYITVTCQTRCKPFLVQPAIANMAKRVGTMPPVELRLNGFGFFNNGPAKTIYAKVGQTEQTTNWFRLLKLQMGIKIKNFVPYIPIANNLPATSFNKLWPNFENRPWQENFIVNSFTILHRETYVEYCEWKVYRELFFANRPKDIF